MSLIIIINIVVWISVKVLATSCAAAILHIIIIIISPPPQHHRFGLGNTMIAQRYYTIADTRAHDYCIAGPA